MTRLMEIGGLKKDLSIELLGRAAITMHGRSTFDPPRLRALLVRLVLTPGVAIQRAALSLEFWPDATDHQAWTNLCKLLYQIRWRLPNAEPFLRSDNHRVLWKQDAPCRVDVHDFLRCINPGAPPSRLKKAIDLYQGPLMPGYYDGWILAERERLQGLYLDTPDRLVSHHEHQGRERSRNADPESHDRLFKDTFPAAHRPRHGT